ncbi:hypothetical protein [Dactylosporangium salmoneum]
MRRAVAGTVVGLALIATAGCDEKVKEVPASSIVGVWRSTCDGTLTVAEGGTFTAESIRTETEGTKGTGPGTWRIEKNGSTSPSPVSLDVKLDDSNQWLSLYFIKRKGQLTMLQYFGDPDNNDTCVFTMRQG